MPYNHSEVEQQLKEADAILDRIFEEHMQDTAIQDHVQKVKNYFHLSYKKAQRDKTAVAVAGNYLHFVTCLEMVKKGEYDPLELKKEIDKMNDARKLGVICHDLIRICQCLFWAATSVALFGAIYLIGLPMMMLQPFIGVAMLASLGGFLLKCALNCVQSLTDLRSFTRHDKEYISESSLLRFFTPKKDEANVEKPSEKLEVDAKNDGDIPQKETSHELSASASNLV